MRPVTLLDTGPLVAALDRRDRYHEWAYGQFGTLPLPFLTCEAVLTEAVYLLGEAGVAPEAVFDLLLSGAIRLAFDIGSQVEELRALLTRYRNVPMDLADACLVQMSERYRGSQILTLDSDFYIYRIRTGEALSVVYTK